MDKRPSFIVIHTDQQRGDCIGFKGRRKGLYTPNMDSIAYQGADFSSCFTTCPVCIPQRFSLLTGQLPEHHGMLDNVTVPYIPFETTLPVEMGRGGYQTAMVGRTMHTYPFIHPYGFEYYLPGDPSSEFKETKDPFFSYIRDHNSKESGGYYGCGAANNSRVGAPFHLEDHFHHTKWATNRALEFLDNRDDSRPFMLFVGYYAPHSPLNPPAEYFNRYLNREDLDEPYIADYDIPPVNNGVSISSYVDLKDEELRSARAGYYGNITFIDNQIGRILDKITMTMPNVYVIFTSDHGELLGDHYMFHKSRPFEGAVHIPFIIKGPGINGNKKIDKPMGWHDIMPTILDLADLPIPDSVDGKSLVPLLKGDGTEVSWREYIHGECFHTVSRIQKYEGQIIEGNLAYEKGSQYITDGKMKYIWYATSGREQLFDIINDYQEQKDLSEIEEYQDVLVHWRKILIGELKGRPEGYSDGEKLIPGCEPARMTKEMQKLYDLRHEEGYNFAYERPLRIAEAKDYVNKLR